MLAVRKSCIRLRSANGTAEASSDSSPYQQLHSLYQLPFWDFAARDSSAGQGARLQALFMIAYSSITSRLVLLKHLPCILQALSPYKQLATLRSSKQFADFERGEPADSCPLAWRSWHRHCILRVETQLAQLGQSMSNLVHKHRRCNNIERCSRGFGRFLLLHRLLEFSVSSGNQRT